MRQNTGIVIIWIVSFLWIIGMANAAENIAGQTKSRTGRITVPERCEKIQSHRAFTTIFTARCSKSMPKVWPNQGQSH